MSSGAIVAKVTSTDVFCDDTLSLYVLDCM